MFTKVVAPSSISAIPPITEIHFLNDGALLSSQPVTPPNSNIGDRVVPKPKKKATTKLSLGEAKGIEYKRSKTKGGQITKPLLNPNEKARTSKLFLVLVKSKVLFPFVKHS